MVEWYIINDQTTGQYGEGNPNCSTIKFETKIIKPNLCDYSDTYILVIENITATGGDANTKVAFKNCAPFTRYVPHTNDEHVETTENLDVIMPMYNLLEYSDNYTDSSGSLWRFKRDEQNITAAGIPNGITTDNSSSFKYKSSFLELIATDVAAVGNVAANRIFHNAIIAVSLKYLPNFFRSLEMPLINCKIHLELSWDKNCVMSSIAGVITFKINTKLHVPIVTLSTKDNVNLTKQLNEGFKRSVYWNEYKSKIETKPADDQNPTTFSLDASLQGVNRLFVLAFNNTDGNVNHVERNSHRKYFLPRVDIT